MKKCPFCAEEIQDEAIKCRFCNEFFVKSSADTAKTKWYFSTKFIVILLLCVGPMALPLVWFNPQYKAVTKICVTILVIVFTILFSYITGWAFHKFM